MRVPNLAAGAGADVAMPHGAAFREVSFQFRALWAIVHPGRSQAAFTSHKAAAQSTLPANKWSRGCRALKSPFWHCAWLPSWQLAPRKKKSFTLTSRFRSSPSTPANTNKLWARALWAHSARPAPFLLGASAEDHRHDRRRFASADASLYAGGICSDTTQRQKCALLPFSSFFLSALSQLAHSQHPSRWLIPFHCRKSLFRPANTSDLTGRAGSLRPAHFDRPFIAKVQSC